VPESGFSAPETRDPTRLPRIRIGLDRGPTEIAGHHHRGARSRPFDLSRARSTLSARRMIKVPRSRPVTSSVARRHASLGLAASLGRTVKMPRIRFYNRRSRHEHPQQHHLWRLPAERRGKPASSRLRDRGSSEGVAAAHSESRRRTTLRSSGPPTAPCLTARRRLRVDRLPLLAQEVMDGAPALSAERALRRIEPSGTFLGRPVASA
jgi:hypothetical protein